MGIKISAAHARKMGIHAERRKSKASLKAMKDPESYRMLVRAACKAHGIEPPMFEYQFDPERKWRFDMAWLWCDPDTTAVIGGVALEVQGGLFTQGRHVRGAALLKEHEKLNEAACRGYCVLYCQPKDVESGAIWPIVKRAMGIVDHGCKCMHCDHEWRTSQYPSPCPKCGKEWH